LKNDILFFLFFQLSDNMATAKAAPQDVHTLNHWFSIHFI